MQLSLHLLSKSHFEIPKKAGKQGKKEAELSIAATRLQADMIFTAAVHLYEALVFLISGSGYFTQCTVAVQKRLVDLKADHSARHSQDFELISSRKLSTKSFKRTRASTLVQAHLRRHQVKAM